MGFKGNDGCLDKAGEDEPIFVLRAQDVLAPITVRLWAAKARLNGAPDAKVDEALDCARAMEDWQAEHPDAIKIPD